MAFEIINAKGIRSYPGNNSVDSIDYIEAACLSSDTKPAEERFATGSICTEVDTGTVFFYNAASKQWVEQFSFQG